ncbi:MAG: HEAT repeat domain-containing protein [Planctomycetes bacterium]|nr:HEAT repeat domain-containing protein [Planctomycetota bacterium]
MRSSTASSERAARAGSLPRLCRLLLPSALGLLAGCSTTSLDASVKKLFEPKRTPQQYMILAVSDSDADVRRQSVGKIAKSKQNDEEWAIKGYTAIALLESNSQTRCVAIRALVQTREPNAAQTCLKIVNFKDQPPQEVREPDALVMGEAVLGLATLSENDMPADKKDAVRAALLDRLAADADVHVRVAAARGLGFYPTDEVVKTLIAGLRDEHFAVVHEVESALVRLTGVTHDCNTLEWEAWYEANRAQLFAKAGQVPESRRPKYTNRWEKAGYNTRQYAEWLWPGPKKTN